MMHTRSSVLPIRSRGVPRLYRNHALVRQWRIKPWVGTTWAVLLLVYSLASGVIQQLDDELKPHDWEWVHDPKTQLRVGITFAALVFLDSARRLVSRAGSRRENKRRAQIGDQLSAAIAAVSDATSTKIGDLGAGLFLVHRSWRHGERLIRIERKRLLDSMSESGVTFRPGVGTVGDCWNTPNPAHHDWSQVNTKYHGNLPSLHDWEKTRYDTKHGFDYESWKVMVGRHAEILAVPVDVDGTKVGVLAIDRKWHEDDPSAPQRLNNRPVKVSVGTIARFLEPILASSR